MPVSAAVGVCFSCLGFMVIGGCGFGVVGGGSSVSLEFMVQFVSLEELGL